MVALSDDDHLQQALSALADEAAISALSHWDHPQDVLVCLKNRLSRFDVDATGILPPVLPHPLHVIRLQKSMRSPALATIDITLVHAGPQWQDFVFKSGDVLTQLDRDPTTFCQSITLLVLPPDCNCAGAPQPNMCHAISH